MMFQHVRFALAAFCLVLFPAHLFAYVGGAPPAYAGNPPAMMDCTSCHSSFELNSGPGGTALLQIPAAYQGSHLYSGQVLIGHTGATSWGYEITAVDSEGNQAGVFYTTPSQAPYTQALYTDGDSLDFLTHTEAGSYPGQTFGVWNFDWFSPPGSTGPVTFYFASLAADGDGTDAGDYVYSSTRIIDPTDPDDPPTAYLLVPWPTLGFGLTPIGSSQQATLTMLSAGNLPLAIEGYEIAGSESFSIENELPDTLHPGDFAELIIRFEPEVQGNFQDTLFILTDSPGQESVAIHLFGSSTFPLAPTAFDLIEPADGATIGAGDLIFRWQASENPDSIDTRVTYTLELSLESDFHEVDSWETGYDTTMTLSANDFIDHRLYFWRVFAQDSNTEGTWSTTHHAFMTDLTNSAEENSTSPEGWQLVNTWPNPFNSTVRVNMQVGRQGAFNVRVFDLLGREVETLHTGSLAAGLHQFSWRPTVASGVYLLRVHGSDGTTQVRKLLYVR
ncbi:T9SS type A sorting domain-containing protein [bacterium]|nr:T9SS type A sorting domain-containing protein [bacterium]